MLGQTQRPDPRLMAVADRAEDHDRIGVHPAAYERDDLPGSIVEPLDVVDRDQQRLSPGLGREQVQRPRAPLETGHLPRVRRSRTRRGASSTAVREVDRDRQAAGVAGGEGRHRVVRTRPPRPPSRERAARGRVPAHERPRAAATCRCPASPTNTSEDPWSVTPSSAAPDEREFRVTTDRGAGPVVRGRRHACEPTPGEIASASTYWLRVAALAHNDCMSSAADRSRPTQALAADRRLRSSHVVHQPGEDPWFPDAAFDDGGVGLFSTPGGRRDDRDQPLSDRRQRIRASGRGVRRSFVR